MDVDQNKKCPIIFSVDYKIDSVKGFVNLFPSCSSPELHRLWILNDLSVSRNVRRQGVFKAFIQRVQELAVASNTIA